MPAFKWFNNGSGSTSTQPGGSLTGYYETVSNPVYIAGATSNNTGSFNGMMNQLGNTILNAPETLMFTAFRCRTGGEDSFVDLTGFDNIKVLSQTSTTYQDLLSFAMNIEFPHIQVTGATQGQLYALIQDAQANHLSYWAYANLNEPAYVCNIKSELSSNSTAWSNYMAEHKNQYNMALNISHMKIQNDQANIAFSAASAVANVASDAWDPFKWGDIGNAVINGAHSVTDATFSYMEQNQQYLYQASGMRGDMSRVSNERLAAGSQAFSAFNYALTWILEYPVQYEWDMISNWFALNGYMVNRWIPFRFWCNRTYFNYIKCAYFSSSLIPQLNVTYKALIDKLCNKGFRVVNNAYINAPGYSQKLDYSLVWNVTNGIISNEERSHGNAELNMIS